MRRQALVVVSLLGMLSCHSPSDDTSMSRRDGSTTPEITVEELHRRVQSGRQVFLLDVRTYGEWADERLPFTSDRISYDSVPAELERLPDDKDAEMYMFCRSGRRSGIVTDYLRAQGYTNVFNVEGGIVAWKAKGYETVSGE